MIRQPQDASGRKGGETAGKASEAPGEARSGRSVEIVAFRESSIITMAKVGALDSLQIRAAFRLACLARQANAETVARASEYIDGGERTPAAERATDAMLELRRVRQLLGRRGYELLVAVCINGRSLVDQQMGYASRRERDTAADMLRMHLDELAELWAL